MNNILSGLSEDWKALIDSIQSISEHSEILDINVSNKKEGYMVAPFNQFEATPWMYVKPYSTRAVVLYEQLYNKDTEGMLTTIYDYSPKSQCFEYDFKNHTLYVIAPRCTIGLYSFSVEGPGGLTKVSAQHVKLVDGVFIAALDSDLGATSKADFKITIQYGNTSAADSGATESELPLPLNPAFDRYYFMCSQYSCVFKYTGGTLSISISGNDNVSIQEVSTSDITAKLSSSTLPATLEITVSKDIELSGLEFVKLHGSLSNTDKVISVNKLSQSWDIPKVNNTLCEENSTISVTALSYGTDKDQYLEVWVKAQDGVLVEVELTNKTTGELTYLYGSENAGEGKTIRHNFGRVFDTDYYEVEISFTDSNNVYSYWANVAVSRSIAAEVNYSYVVEIQADTYPQTEKSTLKSFTVNCCTDTRWMIIGEEILEGDQAVVLSDTSGQQVEQVQATAVPSLYFNVRDSVQGSSFVDYTGSEEAVKKGMIPCIGAFPFPQSFHSYSPNFNEYSVGFKTTNEQRVQVVEASLGISLSNVFVYPYILSGVGPLSLKGESRFRSWINHLTQSNGTMNGIMDSFATSLRVKKLVVASWQELGSVISYGDITTIFNVGTGLPNIMVPDNHLCGLHFFKLDNNIYLDGYDSSKTHREDYDWNAYLPNGSEVMLNQGTKNAEFRNYGQE